MDISRRTLMSALPTAATLVAGIGPPAASAAGRRRDGSVGPDGQDRLLANADALFAGDTASNARAEVAAKLTAIDTAARRRLAALDGAGPGELFRGTPLGTSEANLNASFQYLWEIALATRVADGGPASDLRGNAAVRRRVLDGLSWLHEHHYGDQERGYYGNWFTWEIGISSHVSRTLALLRDEVAAHRPELTGLYIASMDAYLRNGKDGDADLDSRFHTGANLADITTNRMLQGAVTGDAERVAKAVADQETVYATIDPYRLRHGVTDGFYADGSFIQHASVAYTGSYGTALLGRVTQTLKLLDGTGLAAGDVLAGVLHAWVTRGFAPLIFEGWMMEVVRGRAVSRTAGGYAAVTAVAESVADLSAYVPRERAAALRGYVKHLAETSRVPPDPGGFVSPVSVARYAGILADPAVPAADLNPPARSIAFNAMDKTVHRRPGFAFALARSSDRISKYEYMNGENLMPWFQGDGAHYLYLSGEDQSEAFGADYFTAVSPYRLAGVTAPAEERGTVPELYGNLWYDNPERGFTASSESQNAYVYFPRGTNTFSGGATLGAFGAAGLVQGDDAAYAALRAGLLPDDFVAYRNARATKSWFLLDDEVVVLSAGVGDDAGRAVTTTVDTRIADPGAAVSVTGRLRDGARWTGAGTAPLAWLRYADASRGTSVGYVFLAGPPPTVERETVARSRRVVRLSNPDTVVTKQVFALSVTGAAGAPAASMAWALVPGASERRLAAYARGPLSVVANDTGLQAVRHAGLGLLAANAFTAGPHRAAWLRLDGPASVLARRTRAGAVEIAVSDPTMRRERVSVTLRGRARAAVAADEGVDVVRVPGGTRIEVTTRRAHGRSFTATLR
ncbi:polysaccharide lyase family 8 super-sandwich domain-containing protein [Streptomyces marincola]|uniref:Silent information regulator protein Sir2 n=1 Tax=Streptomyces marincola TaxID=2878388 RepID=A0A1W7D4T4_9ACTN|nr:polysaccharide lyase family 8 super-sandwich domain-containing protein [Streptomyces marincola]ARP51738.1 silent information regulator protein Sir2 [Streptomyces marincola]ARQ72015.1 silent information regulator protein Sir2 [Streptomyces marincola]